MSPQNILPSAATVISHHQDADCERAGTVDPETGDCRHPDCGVGGSDPCPSCGGRRFHVDGCLDSPAPYKFFQAAGGMYLEEDPEAPQRFAVWRPVDDSFEIIGAGPTPDAALAEARAELLQEKADRDAVRKSRPASFSDGPWSATVKDDAFSYCPTFTAEFQDGNLWVVHLDKDERSIAIFRVETDDEDMHERDTERCDIPPGWFVHRGGRGGQVPLRREGDPGGADRAGRSSVFRQGLVSPERPGMGSGRVLSNRHERRRDR